MRGVSYWEFFFTVMGDFETLISKQKNSKETSRQLLPIFSKHSTLQNDQ